MHLQPRIDGFAVHQLEVRCAFEMETRKFIQDEIEQLRAKLAGKCLRAAWSSPRFSNTGPRVPPQAQHLRNEGWRMLSVSVHDNDSIASGMFYARAQGGFFPEVPAEAQCANFAAVSCLRSNDAPRVVRRTVVHEHKFIWLVTLLQGTANAREERRQMRAFPEHRHND